MYSATITTTAAFLFLLGMCPYKINGKNAHAECIWSNVICNLIRRDIANLGGFAKLAPIHNQEALKEIGRVGRLASGNCKMKMAVS